MQNRDNYSEIEDFLTDVSFQDWVRTDVDAQDWERWTLESPSRAKLVEEARLWILALKVPENNMPYATLQSALVATWNKIEQKENKKSNNWNFKFIKAAAAVLVLGLGIFGAYNHFKGTTGNDILHNRVIINNQEEIVEQTNNTNEAQTITLSDGSSVLLQPKSKLSYPKLFIGNKRKVYLSGEGFFEISKNPKRPFLVYANEIVTTVVGTSFRISAFKEEPNVQVLVRTGKVKVQSNKLPLNSVKNKEITLLPNEAIRFTKKSEVFNKITDITKDKQLNDVLKPIEQLSFEFTDTPVSQIFKTIEQAYLVNITFPKEKLKDCHLTTSLNDQPLPEKLKIICRALGNSTSYEMNQNQINISSDGCN
ncbi:iron dicitrate transport regulator FecR [Flavobacterium faecale]|uniref:Iron dicitrate transport regulator FecR n=1 Tax=Flavobacterium faecale TaxID=1355330 RepID=A0A2S1LDN0_9FLAO|nr:FecR family protein [Flavobacterium faecale]AWG21781.1 iron dicitrate transport regulator FecR [Flavobacterium faecale]